jgi:hypothetical protein
VAAASQIEGGHGFASLSAFSVAAVLFLLEIAIVHCFFPDPIPLCGTPAALDLDLLT